MAAGGQASEQDLITGLSKPAGVAVVGDQLFVSDQGTGKVLAYSLAAVRAQPAKAEDGRVVAGTLYAVAPDGKVRTLASGWPGIRGVAYDAQNKRLFAAVTAPNAASPATIRIVPID